MEDVDNVDWVPSQHMGHVYLAISKQKDAVERKGRVDKRKKLFDSTRQKEMQSEVNYYTVQIKMVMLHLL